MSSEESRSYRTTDDPNGEGNNWQRNKLTSMFGVDTFTGVSTVEPTNSSENIRGVSIVEPSNSDRPTGFAMQSDSYRPLVFGASIVEPSNSSEDILGVSIVEPSNSDRPTGFAMQSDSYRSPLLGASIVEPSNSYRPRGFAEQSDLYRPSGFALNLMTSVQQANPYKPSCCIYKLPQAFHDGNEKEYVPQIVSIGPFHHGKQSLQPMEEYKRWYQQFLLPRNGGLMSTKRLQDIVKRLEQEAREHYSETIDLDSNAFAEMMVLDCCFLIALFRKIKGELITDQDDPIFKMRWVILALRRDLLMLENQVPFFILQTLFDHINTQVAYRGSSLDELALHFFNDCRPNHDMKLKRDQKDKSLHLLHLFYTSLISKKLRNKSEEDFPPVSRINSLTKLQDAGLKLRKCKRKSFLDIRFKDEILEIPPLEVQDFTCSQLLNLVAFEQCYPDVPTHITAYALFMDCLIDSPEDVDILCQKKIINNWLGNNEQVANLFNKLGRDVVITTRGCYLSKVLSEVNEYCGRDWPAWRENLMRKYCQSPWTICSLVGAFLLLSLTIAQTIMSFVAYFDPPSS